MEYINEEKINKIKLENSNFYVVIDFDKTITSYESEDSWDVTGRAANNINCDKEIESLYKKYRPIELDYTISIEKCNYSFRKFPRFLAGASVAGGALGSFSAAGLLKRVEPAATITSTTQSTSISFTAVAPPPGPRRE